MNALDWRSPPERTQPAQLPLNHTQTTSTRTPPTISATRKLIVKPTARKPLDCLALYRAIGREVPQVRVQAVHPYTNNTAYKVIFTEEGDANRVLKRAPEIERHLHNNYKLYHVSNAPRTERQDRLQLQAVTRNIPLEIPVCEIHSALQTKVDSDHIKEVIRITSRQTGKHTGILCKNTATAATHKVSSLKISESNARSLTKTHLSCAAGAACSPVTLTSHATTSQCVVTALESN